LTQDFCTLNYKVTTALCFVTIFQAGIEGQSKPHKEKEIETSNHTTAKLDICGFHTVSVVELPAKYCTHFLDSACCSQTFSAGQREAE